MYKTKLYCDKHEAFTKLGEVTGGPYVQVKETLPVRWKGKQFTTQPGKTGKKHGFGNYEYKESPFDDSRGTGTSFFFKAFIEKKTYTKFTQRVKVRVPKFWVSEAVTPWLDRSFRAPETLRDTVRR
jgi:hypothetical protein